MLNTYQIIHAYYIGSKLIRTRRVVTNNRTAVAFNYDYIIKINYKLSILL